MYIFFDSGALYLKSEMYSEGIIWHVYSYSRHKYKSIIDIVRVIVTVIL